MTFFSDQELTEAGVSADHLAAANYVKAGYVLEEIDRFAASFFGINAREAAI